MVLSGPTISSEKLDAARKSEKAGDIPDFRKPYVKLEFTKAGEFKGWALALATYPWAGAKVMRPGK